MESIPGMYDQWQIQFTGKLTMFVEQLFLHIQGLKAIWVMEIDTCLSYSDDIISIISIQILELLYLVHHILITNHAFGTFQRMSP